METEYEGRRHPFLEGLSKHRGAPPTVMIIFGASGDLTSRKLIPALYNLALDNLLPSEFYLIGYGRSELEEAAFREMADEAIASHSRRPLRKEVWTRIREGLSYQSGDYGDAETFRRLYKRILEEEKRLGRDVSILSYISTPPAVFKAILAALGESGIAGHRQESNGSRVVIEKPFGRDLASARDLNQALTHHFTENQIYRIDHYLGKETVQDLLVQRFANAIFEPIWNREYVDHVQITVTESIGVGSRGGYYDESGALRDMIQNHTMQLLALTAMEPPVSLMPESIRDEKVKVLKAIQGLDLKAEGGDVVRARYSEGLVEGEKAVGYLQEKGIPADSTTETYAALKLYINNWRWKGVPFYVRSGKRLARRASEIVVQFRRPPGILFSEGERFNVAPNLMVLRIQPDEGVTIRINSKVPGLETRTQPVKMDFGYKTTFGSNTPEAYERLILDSMVGDSTLFIRGDETEESWRIMTPVLKFWESCRGHGLETYVAGSWGPTAADRMLWENQHEWRRSGA